MEKTLRVLGSEDGHAHAGHSHSHAHGTDEAKASGVAKNSADGELRSRGKSSAEVAAPEEHEPEKTGKQPSKLSAYLNLFGDFVHNM